MREAGNVVRQSAAGTADVVEDGHNDVHPQKIVEGVSHAAAIRNGGAARNPITGVDFVVGWIIRIDVVGAVARSSQAGDQSGIAWIAGPGEPTEVVQLISVKDVVDDRVGGDVEQQLSRQRNRIGRARLRVRSDRTDQKSSQKGTDCNETRTMMLE